MCTSDEDEVRREDVGRRHVLSCDGCFEEIHLQGKIKVYVSTILKWY
jgi:hypothetical protein